jgi:hypothetical protein
MNREQLRKKFSALLIDTSEDKPLECNIPFGDSYGLSTLELPTVISMFQISTEGIIYFQIEGVQYPMEFDEFSVDDLKEILKSLTI